MILGYLALTFAGIVKVVIADDICTEADLGIHLPSDISYAWFYREKGGSLSYNPLEDETGVTLPIPGSSNLKVAEINMENNCTRSHSISGTELLLCRSDLYLLDSEQLTRSNYFKLPKIGNHQPVFRSSFSYGLSVLILSTVEGLTHPLLTHVNIVDSTISHLPDLLWQLEIKSQPQIKINALDGVTYFYVAYDSLKDFRFAKTLKNSTFLLGQLNSIGVPLPSFVPEFKSIFNPFSEDHLKTTILEIVPSLKGDLVYFYLHEDFDLIQAAGSSYSFTDHGASFNWQSTQKAKILFKPATEDYLKERQVEIIQIEQTPYVFFHFPRINMVVVCAITGSLKPNDQPLEISNCTNGLPIMIDPNEEMMSVTFWRNDAKRLSFILECKDRQSDETIRSLELQVVKSIDELIQTSEWYKRAKFHRFTEFDGKAGLVTLRDRYYEFFLNTTGEVKVDISTFFPESKGSLK